MRPSSFLRGFFVSVICCGIPATLFASSGSPLLIPTLYNGEGALGSRWSTSVVLNNHESKPFSSPGVTFAVLCFIPEGCMRDTINPGEFGAIWSPTPANGLLLYLPSEDARISFMARFAAPPRNSNGGGTELPIVREHEFRRDSLEFPYVPIGPYPRPLRTTVRVYAPDAQPGTSVRIDLRSWTSPEGRVEFSKTVALDIPVQPADPPIFPGYAQLILQNEFPDYYRVGTLFNVSVVPLSLDATTTPRIWAFITITDNVTQEVTVQTPQ